MISNVFNIDCMEGMKESPDKFFELAIVDQLEAEVLEVKMEVNNGPKGRNRSGG